jgi:hypothetical protein
MRPPNSAKPAAAETANGLLELVSLAGATNSEANPNTTKIQAARPACKFAGLTLRQTAEVFNVSERLIYAARKVLRLRPDLEPEVMSGSMSLNEAHRVATGKSKPTSWDRLVRAWGNATDDDRARLIEQARP